MSVRPELYSTISSILAESPELRSSLKFCQSVEENNKNLDEIQNEIQLLFSQCSSQLSFTDCRDEADDMLNNITDGRFETLLNYTPDIIEMNEESKRLTMKKMEFIIDQLQILLEKNKQEKPTGDAKGLLNNLSSQDSASDTMNLLEKCVQSLWRFKSTFNKVEVHNNLLASNRDLEFEKQVKEVMQHINDFTEVIEARRTIDSLSNHTGEERPLSWTPAMYCAISELLEHVESINYLG